MTHLLRSSYSKKAPIRLNFIGPGRTKQSFQEETDINTIMARFVKTGMLEFVNKHNPQYGDVSNVDFQTSMETVAKSREMFADLPAKIRDRFNNDPAELLEFLDNPENKEEAVLLGLAKPAPKAPEKEKEPTPPATKAEAKRRRRGSDEPTAKSKEGEKEPTPST